jgi:methionine sulfoxide reductase heme-binding subunit
MAVTALTSPLLWYTARATGIASLLLLTAATVLGALTASRSASSLWPRFAVSEVHRQVSLLAVVFLAVHILSSVLDTFVHIPLLAAVVPFISSYRPFWVGLGAVAFDLFLAVIVSSLLKARISAPSWRAIHWLALACWPVAVIHSIGIGTDIRFGWLQFVVGSCIASVLAAVAWRWWRWMRRPQPGTPLPHTRRTQPRKVGPPPTDRRPASVGSSSVRGERP